MGGTLIQLLCSMWDAQHQCFVLLIDLCGESDLVRDFVLDSEMLPMNSS
jgi:hypothetical protein